MVTTDYTAKPAKINFSKLLIPLIIILLLVGGTLLLTKTNLVKGITSSSSAPSVSTQRLALNKSFEVPLTLSGKESKPIKFTLQNAQLTNRIFVSKKAQFAPANTRYLMLNLLIENENPQGFNMKTRDMVRLIDTNGKKFAPSYYNKSAAVQPDAVKKDIVGFLVPADIKVHKLQVGLPDKDKETLELKFQ